MIDYFATPPYRGGPRPRSLAERFWDRVNKTENCWLWTGACNQQGYGTLLTTGHRGRPLRAHRVSWEMNFGPIPAGLWVLHHCDEPGCVRPDHLFLGDRKANAADMVAKGRSLKGDRNPSRRHPERLARGDQNGSRHHPECLRRGDRHPAHKLTADDIATIRFRYCPGYVTHQQLADHYGVHRHLIYLILKRKVWSHLP